MRCWRRPAARERRLRVLPSRVGVYFVLALGLFPRPGLPGGVGEADRGAGRAAAWPCRRPKALRDLRRRIGAAPVKALFEVLAGPAGPAVHAGGDVRPVPDGGLRRLPSIKVPDTAAEPGLAGQDESLAGARPAIPVIQLMTLGETGTRALLGRGLRPARRPVSSD